MSPRQGNATVVIMAKSPRAGRVKTRLCPPCTFAEAAVLATAALEDTLAAVRATPGIRRVVALEGPPGPWLPDDVRVVAQVPGGLGARLAAAATAVGGPVVLIGMDTPQIEPWHLEHALESLHGPGIDAVLGRASDGGYWAVGLRFPDGSEFDGVPMSRGDTCVAQRRRLRALGFGIHELPELRDVDTFDDALLVATQAPSTRFAAAVRAMHAVALS